MIPHPPEVRAAVVEYLRQDAGSYAEAAAQFGIPTSTIQLWKDQAGLPPRKPGRRPDFQRDEIALTGGQWVRDGLVMRWEVAS